MYEWNVKTAVAFKIPSGYTYTVLDGIILYLNEQWLPAASQVVEIA